MSQVEIYTLDFSAELLSECTQLYESCGSPQSPDVSESASTVLQLASIEECSNYVKAHKVAMLAIESPGSTVCVVTETDSQYQYWQQAGLPDNVQILKNGHVVFYPAPWNLERFAQHAHIWVRPCTLGKYNRTIDRLGWGYAKYPDTCRFIQLEGCAFPPYDASAAGGWSLDRQVRLDDSFSMQGPQQAYINRLPGLMAAWYEAELQAAGLTHAVLEDPLTPTAADLSWWQEHLDQGLTQMQIFKLCGRECETALSQQFASSLEPFQTVPAVATMRRFCVVPTPSQVPAQDTFMLRCKADVANAAMGIIYCQAACRWLHMCSDEGSLQLEAAPTPAASSSRAAEAAYAAQAAPSHLPAAAESEHEPLASAAAAQVAYNSVEDAIEAVEVAKALEAIELAQKIDKAAAKAEADAAEAAERYNTTQDRLKAAHEAQLAAEEARRLADAAEDTATEVGAAAAAALDDVELAAAAAQAQHAATKAQAAFRQAEHRLDEALSLASMTTFVNDSKRRHQ